MRDKGYYNAVFFPSQSFLNCDGLVHCEDLTDKFGNRFPPNHTIVLKDKNPQWPSYPSLRGEQKQKESQPSGFARSDMISPPLSAQPQMFFRWASSTTRAHTATHSSLVQLEWRHNSCQSRDPNLCFCKPQVSDPKRIRALRRPKSA